jgi:membrane-associated protease RseP (regulator of RpoE activity)
MRSNQLWKPLVAVTLAGAIVIPSLVVALRAQDINRDARQEARTQLRQDIEARPAASAIVPGNPAGAATILNHRAADLGLWLNQRPGASGLVVADLAAQGVLANAGLLEGDQIVSINGRPATTEAQLVQLLLSPQLANQPIAMVVLRGGQQQTITLQPGALMQGIAAADPLFHAGMVLDAADSNRVVVQRVFPRTPAYYAGLRTGDVIGTINGQPITSPALLSQALTAGGNVNVQVTRNGQTRDLAFTTGDLGQRTAMLPGALSGTAGTTATVPGTSTTTPGAIGPIGAVGRPTSPSLHAQPFVPGGAQTAVPGARTAVPGAPTAAAPAALPSGTLPPTGGLPAAGSTSPRNTVVPAFGSPSATGATGTLGGAGSTAGGAGATGGTGATLGGAGSTAGPGGGAAASGAGGTASGT